MANVSRTLSVPSIVVNNQVVWIIPGSFSYTEGFGEQSMKTQSAGGGTTGIVFSENVESKFSSVKFKMYATADNISAARDWKSSGIANAISFVAADGFSRHASNAAILNDYEVGMSPDGEIDMEWKTSPVV